MQQREHGVAVRDGPGVSDSGLRRAVISGLQCGGLVPLTPHLPSKPFGPGHKHPGPVPGKRDTAGRSPRACRRILIVFISPELLLTRRCPLHWDDSQPVRPSEPFSALSDNLFVGESEPGTFKLAE